MKRKRLLFKLLSVALVAVMIVGSLTAIVACEESAASLYAVKYILNDGTNHPENPATYTEDGLPLTIKSATRDNYNFLGWTSELNEEKQLTVEIPKGTNKNLTFTAHWEDESYDITYSLDGGTNHPDNPYEYTANDLPLVIKEATKESHIFTGWTSELSAEKQLTVEIPRATYQKLTFTAHWEEIIEGDYIVTYALNNGTNHTENPDKYTADDLPLTIGEPTKPGYIFLGWTSEINSENQLTVEIPEGTKAHLSFTAHWQAVEYFLTYVLNDGINHPENPDKYTADDLPLTINVATKTKSIFLGWTSKLNEDKQLTVEIPRGTLTSLTFTAHWDTEPDNYGKNKKKAPDFTVTNLDGQVVSLSDFYGIKPVFVSFWAYWCGPCLTEMNNVFNRVYADMQNEFELLAIHIYDRAGLDALLKTNNYVFPIFDDSSNNAINKGYSTGYIPSNYMVDRWGYLYKSNNPGALSNVKAFNLSTMPNIMTMKGIINAAIARAK